MLKVNNPTKSNTTCNRTTTGELNGDAGIRTQDQRIKSPIVSDSNLLPFKIVTSIPDSGCSAGCSDRRDEGGMDDPELAAVIDAWPTLPTAMKAAIRALVVAV